MPAHISLAHYILVMKTIFYSFASLIRKILFSSLEDKIHIFAPPCNILYVTAFWYIFSEGSLNFVLYISFSDFTLVMSTLEEVNNFVKELFCKV